MTHPQTLLQHGVTGSALTGELIIDAHMHFGTYNNFFMPEPAFESLIRAARRIGIKRLYGSSLLAIRGDAMRGNAEALELHAKSPTLFFPYLVFKPNYPEEVHPTLNLAKEKNIRQFKIHDDGNDLRYDDRRYLPLYEFAHENHSVILVHTYGSKHVAPVITIAKQFPGITILLAHAGIVDESIYAEAVRSCENICLETCNSMAWYGLIERLVGMAGADRVLFGTDMPFMSPEQQIGRVLFARLSDDEKRKILGLNARRVFEG